MRINGIKIYGLLGLFALSSCTKTDLYDEFSVENETKKAYEESFIAKFPNVNLNQSWDYSTKAPSYGLLSDGKKMAATRVGSGGFNDGGSFSTGDWYEVDNKTVDWMFGKLTENVNHKDLGKPFYMTTPGNDFTIVPILQGGANAAFNLHVVIDGVDHEVWTKTADIEIKDDYNDWCLNNWTTLAAAWEHDKVGDGHRGWHGDMVYSTLGGERVKDNGDPVKVTAVRSRKIEFKNIPAGKDMYFYLKIYDALNAGDNYCKTGDVQSSLAGAMIALTDAPIPDNLMGKDAMIIGCEDAGRESSDWDYNDVAFLVYGDKKPEPVVIEGKPVVETTTVRYMVEDLGATDDFDFNDVVIDVANITVKTPVYVDNKFDHWNYSETKQKAIIRHLGGSLPFILTVGNTELPEMGGQETFQTSPNAEFDVTGYDFNKHNITVQVRQMANDGVYNNVKFPKAGEVPMIIAVNPEQDWMPERQTVPEEWFYIPENK